MKVLALDPATSTGYALIEIDNGHANIYEYGFLDIDPDMPYIGDKCNDLYNRVEKIIDEHDIELVCIEDYFYSSRFCSGTNLNGAFRTALHMLCRNKDLHYEVLNISLWKKFVAGRSTPTKDQKKKWGKEASKKLYMQQALYDNYGFKFPNHSLSEKTGKPILFRYDIVDAVAQAIFYCFIFLKVKSIGMSVKIPDDVEFKRKSKKMFTYEGENDE